MADPERRRRRLRHTTSGRPRPPVPGAPGRTEAGAAGGAEAEDGVVAATADVQDPEPPVVRGGGDDREAERGLRGLVGSGSSQVGTSAAMRARDAARPTGADLADAEQNLVIVRRNWVPRD